MKALQASLRVLAVIGLLLALAIDFLLRPVDRPAQAAWRIHRYCKRILRALGVSWSAEGAPIATGAIISNHLSYLDILVFAAAHPFIMVAKSEVRGWPGIGWLTRKAGTVYVVRGGGPATYPAVNRAMAEAYRCGFPVLFFPEGTTTDGSEILPFRRGLFHSVLNEGVELQAAALHYASGDPSVSVANDVCWWGDALLLPHIWRLAQSSGVQASLRFGTALSEREDRFVLSQSARQEIVAMYGELALGAGAVERVEEPELVEALQDLLDRPVQGIGAFDRDAGVLR
ncbi:1-acyl-sn-glycerol-3-phosphate acyltransferase [Edaphobacter sp. 12200R-103]|nr:1-acyl-sn-glycerol-3-phosphate acyltransferase [Edaphobacter sp. 12200R-103]